MATRLDRLFLLLDTGSTAVARKAAAQQLGEVQKLHPHELHNLLAKVHGYLRSTSWETRIAAGLAVEAICKNVPQWQPKPAAKQGEDEEHSCGCSDPPPPGFQLTFATFDLDRVLRHGAALLGSEGDEYDMALQEFSGLEQKERLLRQRQILNKRLGLDVAGSLGVETGELFTDEDLISHSQPLTPTTEKQQEVIQLSQLLPSMSNREKNIAKRKAKTLAKQRSRDLQPTEPGSQPSEQPCKKRRTANVLVEQPADDEKLVIDSVPDNALFWEQNEEWPFELFCESLTYDLFSTHWEVRHGAAIGLREVLRQHAGGAGRTPGMDAAQQEGATQRYLEDIALRTTCVLALDKFGDFVSDEVVAPVRESCAQALGIVLSVMREDAVVSVMNILITLLRQEQWEARHGALLGLKYLLAVRKELTAKLLPEVFPSVFAGLQDSCDDVSAVSAAALAPVADDIVNFLPDQVTSLITCLWDLLLDLDDLTAATNSMMSLLSSLLANSHVSYTHRGAELHELVPRLWPFLGHSIKSVRRSALATLQTLVAMENTEPPVNIWLPQVLQEALRTLFQRCIVESNQEILHIVYETWCAVLERAPQEAVAAAACPWINVWLCLMMQPAKVAIDHSLVIVARTQPERSGKVKPTAADPVVAVEDDRDYIGGKLTLTASPVDHDAGVVRARSYAAKCLGKLAMIVTAPQASYPEGVETPLEGFCKLICFHLNSKSATQRLCTALLVSEWSQADVTLTLPDAITVKLRESVNESVYFDEIAPLFTRMQAEAKDLVATLTKNNAELDASYTGSVLTIEQALALSSSTTWRQLSTSASFHGVEEKQRCLAVIATHTQAGQHMLNVRVQACLAVALIVLKSLPDKLNPVIRPLMDSLKQEENIQLQLLSAWGLARVMEQCIDRHPSPNTKIVKNLCSIVCAAATPVTGPSTTGDDSDTSESGSQTPTLVLPSIVSDRFCGILTLVKQQKACDKLAPRRYKKGGTINVDANIVEEVIDEQQKQMATQRRGAQFGLSSMAQYFGAALFDKLPVLWEAINHCSLTQVAASSSQNGLSGGEEQARELANSLHVLETVGPALHPQLHDKLLGLSLRVCDCLRDRFTAVRHRAARCLAMLAKVCGLPAMTVVLEQVLPLLGTTDSDVCRQGAVEALANVIELLDFEIVPYIVLLVLPVLGRISDHNENIRLMATQCFASLIRLMPLESGIVDPPELKPCLVEQKARQRCFMQQLLDSNKADDYKVPVPIHAELRKYQQDGVNWLAFLNKYKLHGILCDDMGLGKTLQSLCILAGDHHLREKAYKETGSADCMPLPSIVVCPPTLTGHWVYEIQKFVACQYLNPLHYTGPPVERARLKPQLRRHNLVIASYDIVRNDIDFFSGVKWNYCILDEGHIIKNGKTKISKAVKQLQACHRLILSGTPIQNNVLELWSLFDFLMPGLLGSERAFTARYGRPILQSRDAKSSMKEQEAGVLAMEALHRQVLPFLLRRMKDDVLQDLPPKIMQDYYCELSTLQVQLYEDFAKSRARVDAEEQMGASEAARPHSHVFQCLQYLRKVCNHPLLVLQPDHPLYRQIADQLDRTATSLCSLQHSGKLVALRQLLQDCGIGVGERAPAEAVVGEHRALVFCQFKSMLDIVEKHLLKPHMPSLTYLRLDGSIPAGSRHSIVNRFNNDPSIDVLLLTTHVGGLGLNLTGADTVIFVEHDWNPMKDLQAMDRAHRIGQKKVVNVYRLITKGTLEEKIMSLQKFKINIANTVISQDNSSLLSMATDQLLDLFALDNDWQETKADQSDDSRQSMKQVLENLGDLWDEKQYEEEYDLGTFMQALHK